jgi:hypothetical protein
VNVNRVALPGSALIEFVGEEASVSIPVKVNGKNSQALIDTGAGTNVIDMGLITKLQVSGNLVENRSKIFAVGNVEMEVMGSVELLIDVGDSQVVNCEFTVLATTEPTFILGRQFLKEFQSTEFDWENSRVRLGHFWKSTDCCLSGGDTCFSRVAAARLAKSDTEVTNCAEFDVNPNLNELERGALMKVLTEFEDVFAENPKKPALMNIAVHVIETSGQPVKQKMARVAPQIAEEIDRQVAEMLENGICRPSSSPWSSRVILVKKKDGSWRFVVDYRALNDQTKKDSYPMPQISDIIDLMNGSQFFSVTDGASAYWSVPLTEDSKEKTAFSVPRGLFELNVMTFGLVNAQATYQRAHDAALQAAPHSAAYVDDACTFSHSFAEHIEDLRCILSCYRRASMQLKRSKCKFGYDVVDFAGYRLSKDGILPIADNVAPILNFPVPKNLQEVQRFVALANYYRNFLPAMSSIAQPLHNLSRRDTPFVWSEVEQRSFDAIKLALVSPPVLRFVDWAMPIFLETDASKCAVGAVLSQKAPNGKLQPIGYSSSGLTDAQKNYSARELECWGIIAAVRKWHCYLQAAPKVILWCDHNPLVWLRSQPDPRGKFGRWINELEEIRYEIVYRPGKDNVGPDCLSRASWPVDEVVNDE